MAVCFTNNPPNPHLLLKNTCAEGYSGAAPLQSATRRATHIHN